MRRAAIAIPLLLLARPAATEPPFSRARWIELHEHEARFDGGALPERESDLAEMARLVAGTTFKGHGKPPTGVVRVSRDVVPPDTSGAQAETEAEPFLAIDPASESRLLAGFQEGRFADGGARALTLAVSTDGGGSWRNAVVPALTQLTGGPWQRASDPWVAFGPDHRAYHLAIGFDETRPDNEVVVSTSTDGGATWGEPVTVHRPPGVDFDDKEAMAVDNGVNSPFRGRVYVTWDQVGSADSQPAMVSFSADGGASFSPPVMLDPEPVIGVTPVVTPDGTVHAVWTRFGEQFQRTWLYTARSTDGGVTWTDPVPIAETFAAGVRGMRTGDGLPSIAADAKTGALYVVWQDSRFSPDVDQVTLSRSTDGGVTWMSPRRVSDGPLGAPNFTPAGAVDGSGRVGIVYYSLRNDPLRRTLVDEYFAFSRNGGLNFLPAVRLSKTSWNTSFAAISRGFFLGDYQGLVAGKSAFHPLFVATLQKSPRTGNPQPDVFTTTVK